MALVKLTLDDPALPRFLEGRAVPFFCSVPWNRVLEEGLGARAAYYALAEGDALVLALCGVHLQLGPVRIFYANIPYGGLIGDATAFPRLVAELGPCLRRERVHEIRIVRTSYDAFDAPAGYASQEAVHHVLDLRGLDFGGGSPFPASVMRNVRKAEHAGVQVRPLAGRAEVDVLYDLYVQTMRRHGAPTTWTRSFLHALHDRLVAAGDADMLLACHAGRVIAGIVLVRSGETVFYFFGASNPDAFALRPNDLLFCEAIRQAAAEGRRIFDFMTSRLTDEGLIRFKEKWGGRPRPMVVYRAELSALYACVWHWMQRVAGSRPGAAVVRWLRGRE